MPLMNINQSGRKMMRRRDVPKALLASAAGAGAAMYAKPAEAQTCSAPCFPQTSREAGANVTPIDLQYEPGDVRRYGASYPGNAENNFAAIQAAINANSIVRIPELYKINPPAGSGQQELNLHSNLTIVFDGAGGLFLESTSTARYILRGNTVENVKIIGGSITGRGMNGWSSVVLEHCTSVLIDGVRISKSGAQGVQLYSCTNCTIRNSDLSNNYRYGVEDRDGTGNRYEGNRFAENGNTLTSGVSPSIEGRGITLWRCVGCFVGSSRFIANTEYGYRIYAEANDSSASYGNILDGCYFEENAQSDILLYDESPTGSLVRENLITNCVVERSIDPGLGTSVLLHGSDNTIENVHVHKNGGFGNFVAFYYYHAVKNKILNCSASHLRDFAVFSQVTDCVIDNCEGNGVATVCGPAGILGSGQVIRGSRFKHGGTGTTDVAIANYSATGRNYIEDNRLEGFSIGIHIGSEAVTLRNNKTIASTSAGLRKDFDAQVGQEIIGNVWDSSNPTFLRYLERKTAGMAVLYGSAPPASRTWARGDRCYNTAPSPGQPKSWVCTVAGAPGTWVSEGTL